MADLQLIQLLLGEFHAKLANITHLIRREVEFPEAEGKIKVVIGMRRVGKTYFLLQTVKDLLSRGVDKRSILYLNFEDDRLMPLDEKVLAGLVEAFYGLYPENHERKCYLFFDEIQNVENWPLVVRRLHDTKKVEIFLSGSSAKLLSKEISTSLRGRSLTTEMWPYSFSEYLKAKSVEVNRELFDQIAKDRLGQYFMQYISEGGFPEIIGYQEDVKQRTLQEYLDVAIFRDIVERHNIKNPSLIKYMLLSVMHNLAKPFSIHKFYNEAKSRGYTTSKDSIYEYADYIEDAYLAFSVPLYDRSVKKSQTNPKKLYLIDSGMARASTLDYENDYGRLFENVVYLELRRKGWNVFYYLTAEGYEVDFLAQGPRGELKLFQVAWRMDKAETLEREERALEAGKKELGVVGEIVTLESYLRNGAEIFNVG